MGKSMSASGFNELEKQFQDINKKLQDMAINEEFCRKVAKELAARLLAKVIRNTPVGQYSPGSGKVGGTLRRGWSAGTNDATAYADSLQITKSGNVYEVEITNPTYYASYVEYGHRTVGGKGMGWVKGKFMLTIAEKELESQSAGVIENLLQKYLLEVFGGNP